MCSSDLLTAVLGGHTSMLIGNVLDCSNHVASGKIRAIAVAMPKRSPKLPHIPTVNELGYKDVDLSNWFAVYAPANTPPAVIQKINAAFVKVGKSQEMRDKFEQLGFDSFFTTPDGGQDFMRAELVRWARVAAYAGIKPE